MQCSTIFPTINQQSSIVLPFTFAYIDNVLIVSKNEQEHFDHLQQVFERIQHFRLKINVGKCIFKVNKFTFLRYEINEIGISPLPEKITAIQNLPYHSGSYLNLMA